MAYRYFDVLHIHFVSLIRPLIPQHASLKWHPHEARTHRPSFPDRLIYLHRLICQWESEVCLVLLRSEDLAVTKPATAEDFLL